MTVVLYNLFESIVLVMGRFNYEFILLNLFHTKRTSESSFCWIVQVNLDGILWITHFWLISSTASNTRQKKANDRMKRSKRTKQENKAREWSKRQNKSREWSKCWERASRCAEGRKREGASCVSKELATQWQNRTMMSLLLTTRCILLNNS